MSRDKRKPRSLGSDQVRHKPACAATEDGQKLEVSDLRREEELYYPCSENKGADQLRSHCAFVFA